MKNFTSRPVVLCLSGHDPSGGAGLQADIEALLAQACHAAPTVTALTVQDTVNVSDFRVLDREWVLARANAVIADLPIAAVKLGMLGSVEMVETVLEIMARLPGVPLVCDFRCCAPAVAARWARRMSATPCASGCSRFPPSPRRICRKLGSCRTAGGQRRRVCRTPAAAYPPPADHRRPWRRERSAQPPVLPRRQSSRLHLRAPAGQLSRLRLHACQRPAGRLALGEELTSAVRSALDYTAYAARCRGPGHGQYVPRRLPPTRLTGDQRMKESSRLRGLYAITDSKLLADGRLLPYVEAALKGGARLLQYRDKTSDEARRLREADALQELCARHGAQLIINDDAELAARPALACTGQDGSLAAARPARPPGDHRCHLSCATAAGRAGGA